MTRSELARTLAPLGAIPREEIPDALGELRRLDAILQARLVAPQEVDRLLTAREAAPLLGVSSDTLYRRADDFPFSVRVGGRLRFSQAGIRRWIEAHGEDL